MSNHACMPNNKWAACCGKKTSRWTSQVAFTCYLDRVFQLRPWERQPASQDEARLLPDEPLVRAAAMYGSAMMHRWSIGSIMHRWSVHWASAGDKGRFFLCKQSLGGWAKHQPMVGTQPNCEPIKSNVHHSQKSHPCRRKLRNEYSHLIWKRLRPAELSLGTEIS